MQRTKIPPREIFERSKEFGVKNSATMLTEIIESEMDDNKRKEAIKYLALIGNSSIEIKDNCFKTMYRKTLNIIKQYCFQSLFLQRNCSWKG